MNSVILATAVSVLLAAGTAASAGLQASQPVAPAGGTAAAPPAASPGAPSAPPSTPPAVAPGSPPLAAPGAPLPPPPWWSKIGLRALDIETRLPVLDQVVLVRDEASYIAEIARWTPKSRWPVLFEDDAFAPRFIRAFHPSVVLRRAPAADAAPADPAARRAAIEAAIVRAWDGIPGTDTIDGAFKKRKLVPVGLVAASASDPAWTAALALAAGRGQPIAWIEQPLGGTPGSVIDASAFALLDTSVRKAMEETGRSWSALGDDLETFTLCRNAALKVTLASPPGGRNPQLPQDAAPLSLTDALCRQPDGSRYAFAAQIFGDRTRAASMAMCSLFLARNDIWMFDGYANRSGSGFALYGFERTSPVFLEQGFTTRAWSGKEGTLPAWRALLYGGIKPDVLFLNSSGNADFFELGSTAMTWAVDVPVLQKPMALSMVHSFSLQSADDPSTVGARWLDHGVYAYAGSVQEPFLNAFIPPQLIAQRLGGYAPFLIATRQWQGDMLPQVWRIATLGDPLMTLLAPKTQKMLPGRLPAALGDDYSDVRAGARAALERVKSATQAPVAEAALAEAIRDMVMVGDDGVAVQIWQLARRRSPAAAAAVAHSALGPLFRTGTRTDFMEAWVLSKDQTMEERDMLWHFWVTSLPTLRDRATIALLKANLRAPRQDMDASALAAAVRSTEGAEATIAWLNSVITQTSSPEAKRRLAELQAKP